MPDGQVEIGDDRVEQRGDDLVGALDGGALDALLAVDAEAELDLVVAELEARPADGRHGAGAERHAHGAERGGGAARDGCDLGERQAAFGGRAGELVDEHGAGNAAPAIPGHQIAQGHVVGDEHHFDRDALLAGELGGEAEIQPVAGVVLDHQHAARRAARGEDGGQHRVGARRGEDVAGNRRRQHAAPDIAGMGRLVPAAAAGDNGDLAGGSGRQVGPDHHVLAVEQGQPGRQVDRPFEQFAHEVARIVDEFLHESSPAEAAGPRPCLRDVSKAICRIGHGSASIRARVAPAN